MGMTAQFGGSLHCSASVLETVLLEPPKCPLPRRIFTVCVLIFIDLVTLLLLCCRFWRKSNYDAEFLSVNFLVVCIDNEVIIADMFYW